VEGSGFFDFMFFVEWFNGLYMRFSDKRRFILEEFVCVTHNHVNYLFPNKRLLPRHDDGLGLGENFSAGSYC